MKTNEFMVGDLIEVISNDHLKYVRIKEIYQSSILTEESEFESEEIGIDNIKPIPLTPEILEKFGWKYNNYNNETEYEEEYYVDENGIDIHINVKKFEIRCIDAVNIQLKYLHELQHALKLCGIEKNIEL